MIAVAGAAPPPGWHVIAVVGAAPRCTANKCDQFAQSITLLLVQAASTAHCCCASLQVSRMWCSAASSHGMLQCWVEAGGHMSRVQAHTPRQPTCCCRCFYSASFSQAGLLPSSWPPSPLQLSRHRASMRPTATWASSGTRPPPTSPPLPGVWRRCGAAGGKGGWCGVSPAWAGFWLRTSQGLQRTCLPTLHAGRWELLFAASAHNQQPPAPSFLLQANQDTATLAWIQANLPNWNATSDSWKVREAG